MPTRATRASARPQKKPWLKNYPQGVAPRLRYPRMAAWRLVARAARSHPDRVACRLFGQQLTYRELLNEATHAAAAISELGLRRGEPVGLLLPNVPEYLVALNGIWMAGAVALPISPLSVAQEVSDLLTATGCRVVVALDLLSPLVTDGSVRPEHVLLVSMRHRLSRLQRLGYALARRKRTGKWRPVCENGQRWLPEVIAQTNGAFKAARVRTLDAPALIQPTGGTTGSPKAVVLTHRNLVANAWQLYHWVGASFGKDTVLGVLPFFHSYGLTTCVMTGAALAATLVLHPRFEPRAVLRLIEEHRPVLFPAVPAMLAALNRRLERRSADLSSLRYCISGGAPLDPEVAEEFAGHSGATVVEGYGLSEASPVTHCGPLDGSARPGTIGLPLPDTNARIVDTKTGRRVLPDGEVGELVVRGPQVMAGYWDAPKETAAALRRGWLHTGDLGTRDSDGFFRIVDRKKDLIITSGFNVYPNEVEEVLRRFPGVDDAAVIGVPDPQRGQQVKAFLVVPRGQPVDERAVERFCKEHLGKHKRPHVIEQVEEALPRNFLGKVLRRNLRDENGQPSEVDSLIG